jgi:hypothetical protein
LPDHYHKERLYKTTTNRQEFELYALSENRFRPLVFEAEITFYKNANGEVDRLVLVQNGETYEAKKIP